MTLHDLQGNSRVLPKYQVMGESIKPKDIRKASYKQLWWMSGQFITDITEAYTLRVTTVTSVLPHISLK